MASCGEAEPSAHDAARPGWRMRVGVLPSCPTRGLVGRDSISVDLYTSIQAT